MLGWIIDDDIALARLLSHELKRFGTNVKAFESSEEALQEDEVPDFVILDGNLNKDQGEWSKGEEVVKKIKEKYGDIVVAAHSSDDGKNDLMIQNGASVIISKGFLEELECFCIDPAIYCLIRKYNNPKQSCSIIKHGRNVALRAIDVLPDGDHQLLWEAGLLHDIAEYISDPRIVHGWKGAEILRKEGMPRHALLVERHVGVGLTAKDIRENYWPMPEKDMVPISPEEKALCWADSCFSKTTNRELTAMEAEGRMAEIGKLEEFYKLRKFFHGK